MPIMDSTVPLPADEPPPLRDLADAWDHILTELRTRIRREQFDTWFRRAVPIALDSSRLRLAVHNAFARDWMNEYYRPALLEATERVLGSPREVEIEVDPERIVALPPEASAPLA